MFSWRSKKDINIFRMKKAPYLLLWCLLGSLAVLLYISIASHTKGLRAYAKGKALDNDSLGPLLFDNILYII